MWSRIGFYYVTLVIVTFMYMICSLRTNICLFTALFLLVITFGLFAGSYFQTALGNLVLAAKLQKVPYICKQHYIWFMCWLLIDRRLVHSTLRSVFQSGIFSLHKSLTRLISRLPSLLVISVQLFLGKARKPERARWRASRVDLYNTLRHIVAFFGWMNMMILHRKQ